MQITIALETGDDPLAQGFGMATDWTDDGTSTIEEWMASKSASWIYEKSIQGKVKDGTTTERNAYIAKIKLVQAAAIAAMPKPIIIKPPR